MISLKNKTVLITGASSGIGMSCAESFAATGARLLLCARRIDILKDLSEKLKKAHQIETRVFACDVRDQTSVTKALSDLPLEWKDVDVLINNAGLASGADAIQSANLQDWDDMIQTNINGLLYITRQILPQMVAKKSGHIINLGSVASHQVYPGGAVYCATKHAVAALSQGLRMDLMGTNVRVSMVSPGAVETAFSTVRFKGDEKKAAAVYAGYEPLQAADIADAVLYCATRPLHVNVSEIFIMPTAQAAVGMIAKN